MMRYKLPLCGLFITSLFYFGSSALMFQLFQCPVFLIARPTLSVLDYVLYICSCGEVNKTNTKNSTVMGGFLFCS